MLGGGNELDALSLSSIALAKESRQFQIPTDHLNISWRSLLSYIGWTLYLGIRLTFCPSWLTCTSPSSSQVVISLTNRCVVLCPRFWPCTSCRHLVHPSQAMCAQLACSCTCWQLECAGQALAKHQPHQHLLHEVCFLGLFRAPPSQSCTSRTQGASLCPRMMPHRDWASPSP
jgi:hypothetical protein